MKLLVGLGNPDREYEDTRHNVGFWVLEAVRREFGLPGWVNKCKGLVSKGKIGGFDVVLLMPQTFMNLSGESVLAALTFYKIELSEMLVVHDELDLGVAVLRQKVGGSDAGHNGLKSITGAVGGDYRRLRVGIGRPMHQAQVSDYVLHAFGADEVEMVEKRVLEVAKAMPEILENPVDALAKLGMSK